MTIRGARWDCEKVPGLDSVARLVEIVCSLSGN
jgi:hypothetical protein